MSQVRRTVAADLGHYDVAVLGGGNAALSAALTARQAGASVIVIECAPRHFRGGNSRHTRNLRCAHAAPTDVLTDTYPEDELMADLMRVNDGETDEALARLVVAGSTGCPDWMKSFGARFQSSLRGTLHLSRTNAFFLGGGTALMNSYYAAAERLGIAVLYDAEVVDLDLREGAFRSVLSGYNAERAELMNGELQSQSVRYRLIELEDRLGDQLALQHEASQEQLFLPFEISPGVIIPVGHYSFQATRVSGGTADQRKVWVSAALQDGGFYSGDRTEVYGGINWRPSGRFRTSLDYTFNDIELPEGDFVTRLVQFSTEVAFSSTLS